MYFSGQFLSNTWIPHETFYLLKRICSRQLKQKITCCFIVNYVMSENYYFMKNISKYGITLQLHCVKYARKQVIRVATGGVLWKKDVLKNLLKRDSNTGVFLWVLRNSVKGFFSSKVLNSWHGGKVEPSLGTQYPRDFRILLTFRTPGTPGHLGTVSLLQLQSQFKWLLWKSMVEKREPHQVHLEPSRPWTCYNGNDL